ncbi:DUF1289 domain-containing protein [Psychromonas sp.]|uniref:DUF1289 domain-containing protein n=1 Tax=Psychromonas sp. TaxID=1884585 RepID=UPI0039E2F923
MNNINSPCIGACSLDANKICQGCFRRMHEISLWGRATNTQKIKILASSSARQKESLTTY